MAFIVKDSGTNFIPAPAGTHRAICVDVVDLGVQPTSYGPKPKLRIVWEIEEQMPDGRRFLVSQRYTVSLNEKASLRHDLESWRGRQFTADELQGFDLEKLLGACALVNVIHRTGDDGKVWANVASISPLPKALGSMSPSGAYVRVVDREPAAEAPSGAADHSDDDIPF